MAYYSEREVRLARSFIKATGGNATNGYLLLAVIAWQRAMTRSHDTFYKSLSKYAAVQAGQLLAARLKRKTQLDAKHYQGILASLRRHASGDVATVKQARDFMLSIQLSEWDKEHYGYKAEVREGYWKKVWTEVDGKGYFKDTWFPPTPEYNPLAIIWQKMTGHNIPKQYFVDKGVTVIQPKAKPPPPRQPRSLIHVLPKPDYIQPYGARTFYEARPHLGQYVLPE
jgi:hypothetical protein